MTFTVLNENDDTQAAKLWKKEQVLEVLVFLFLIVPSMALSLFVIRRGGLGFNITANAIILRDLALVCLILFFLWRNGEPRSRIGWNFQHLWREVILGVALFIPFFWIAVATELTFRWAGLSVPSTPMPSFLTASDIPQIVLAFVPVAVVGVAEETIFRGYLLLRFGATMGTMTIAVASSSLIFSLGHGYEGAAGLATVGVMGVALCLVYL